MATNTQMIPNKEQIALLALEIAQSALSMLRKPMDTAPEPEPRVIQIEKRRA